MIDPFLSTSTDKPETISRMEITRMRTRRPGKRLPSNHSRASVNLIVEPGLYMLLRFQKAAVGGNYETRNQAFQCVGIFDHTGFWLAELVGTAPHYTVKAAVRILFVTSLRLPEETAGLRPALRVITAGAVICAGSQAADRPGHRPSSHLKMPNATRHWRRNFFRPSAPS